ncbi:predicted protein [Postia placenta Mad-698-R]|uniref:Wax synthase domain-containing protein n=1 Tax=Postia placenta MAD-698-R-SB12 TaxID=670580 RepID=A0A1X6MPJ7_9APHY|nr:hypothetical protein POSPLADRAFT_1154133 [Postia placenta MAD-698-R-SB12]EED84098.1 predicted protein [Postia placenta Mad-698-R]OSX58189.1 hypothetical protein POSPLADRAFT_1154133 [Postia placenta MAD-698-R-SB12]
MSVDNRPRLPVLPVLLLQNAFLSALIAIRPKAPIKLAAFAIYTYSLGLVLTSTTGDLQQNYSLGCSFASQFFTAFHLLWLADPLNDLRHERDHTAPPALPFLRRMYWASCVITGPRGVGWNYQVANIPPRPSEPRWTFVRHQSLCAFRWYLLVDLAQTYQRSNPSFSHHDANLFSLSAQGYIQRCINIVARFAPAYGMIAMPYCLLSALSVAMAWSFPRDWPTMYGEWADAYTLRRFWGRTYHQLLRRYTASMGKACCRLLGLRQGSWASSYTQLYVGFAVSGLMHCGGDFMVSPKLFGASFPFFIAQAAAISLEDAVVGLAKRTGLQAQCPDGLVHALGYVWVFVWLNMSVPWYLNWLMRAGVIDTSRMPFSLVTMLVPTITTGAARFLSLMALSVKA